MHPYPESKFYLVVFLLKLDFKNFPKYDHLRRNSVIKKNENFNF